MEQRVDIPASQEAALYGEDYYRSQLGPDPYDRSNVALVNFFAIVADQVIRSLRPARVLDAGCAMGFLVEAFWDRGVQAWGIDISEYAISKVRRDMAPYCRVVSLTHPIEGSYDLITCIEVLEHLPEADSLAAIRNLAGATDAILFSSSPTDLTEPTHINVHQPLWWLEQFQQAGFFPDLTYDASYITPQAFLLRKTHQPIERDVLRLFSEFQRYKLAHAEQKRTLDALQETRAERTQSSSETQATDLSELRDAVSALTDRHAIVLRELERISGGEPDSMETLRADAAAIRADMHNTSAALSGVRSELEVVREDIQAARVDASNSSSGLSAVRSELEVVRAATVAACAGLETLGAAVRRNRADQEEARASLAKQLDEILQSRIWRTLTRAGGLLLRLRGGG